ncbi:AHL_G0034020.mRNA.1.CDS.1 [Saccharomyces cerevisiae]|nr:CPG_1a_G0033920.mRNA.1.CDS.1 [Saccharomyces cerevisiae]CAI4604261.1 AIE_G0033760.mRNA.1.CDS.1 [Saccharomyces cerevisiae]CAI4615997.1 AVB_G0034150.mRNA.1.CDS.1 [Saccharomyces cerevisiae]CAI4890297.1 AHL_G0034020.mRNA.1.CDS.1 [Saccharomyces cerevisiae]CAI6776457.1 AIE_G0033760.mRNA.1.CDS.1 [Saccharomyces cerevisiae]
MSGEDYMTSDDENDAEKRYVRPIFVRKRKGEEDDADTSTDNDHHYHHHPCDRPERPSQRQNENTQSNTIRLVPVTMSTVKCPLKKKKKKSMSTSSHDTTLFEYGESIAGYKCVTTEREIDRLKQRKESESTSESEVDVFAFDQANGSEAKVEAEERYARVIRQYWRMTKDEPAILPLPDTPTLAAVTLDMINEYNVAQFYTMSSALMDANRVDLIRRDRIRWHPDKHRYHKPKVTKLFQAINGLWEQVKTEK